MQISVVDELPQDPMSHTLVHCTNIRKLVEREASVKITD